MRLCVDLICGQLSELAVEKQTLCSIGSRGAQSAIHLISKYTMAPAASAALQLQPEAAVIELNSAVGCKGAIKELSHATASFCT